MWSGSGVGRKARPRGRGPGSGRLCEPREPVDGVGLRVGLWVWLGVSGVSWRPGLSGMLGGAVPIGCGRGLEVGELRLVGPECPAGVPRGAVCRISEPGLGRAHLALLGTS